MLFFIRVRTPGGARAPPLLRRSTSLLRHRCTHAFPAPGGLDQVNGPMQLRRKPRTLRLDLESALVAPVWRGLSFKTSYLVRFDGLPGLEKTDTVLTVGIQLTR